MTGTWNYVPYMIRSGERKKRNFVLMSVCMMYTEIMDTAACCCKRVIIPAATSARSHPHEGLWANSHEIVQPHVDFFHARS